MEASGARLGPLAIDLFCGLGGWTDGLMAEGYDVVGFDIECHVYGEQRYPAQLVVQDVMTLHGSQFRNADLIVASPPCQEFSYMAMPWSRAKQIRRALRGHGEFPESHTGSRTIAELTALFDACFRIQREASVSSGRLIPLIVENVRGANEWVGRSRWNYGSFHLWGDVPALMPPISSRAVFQHGIAHRADGTTNFHGQKIPGFRFDGSGKSFQTACVLESGTKNTGGSWFNIGSPGQKVTNKNPVHELSGTKGSHGYERDHPEAFGWKKPDTSSHSNARKFASAMIARIPLPLSRHIGATFKPRPKAHAKGEDK